MLPELFHLADYGLTLNLMVNLITAGHHVITQSQQQWLSKTQNPGKKRQIYVGKHSILEKKRRKAGMKASNTVREKVS